VRTVPGALLALALALVVVLSTGACSDASPSDDGVSTTTTTTTAASSTSTTAGESTAATGRALDAQASCTEFLAAEPAVATTSAEVGLVAQMRVNHLARDPSPAAVDRFKNAVVVDCQRDGGQLMRSAMAAVVFDNPALMSEGP
jgi:hypothetical protein